jgi:medium-chain acyl-[acyl-carrier-protein] hydrolase
MSTSLSPHWLVKSSCARPVLRLFCFAYAGGNSSIYLDWQRSIHPGIEICPVQLPGRGARYHEAPYAAWSPLMADLSRLIARHSEVPFAFFGHSLGALIAFELARHCRMQRVAMPRHIIVSGCTAPHLRRPPRRLYELDDDGLIAAMAEHNGTPRQLLGNRELMELVLPVIRADFRLGDAYSFVPDFPLAVPLTVMAGRADPYTSPAEIAQWARHSVAAVETRWFDGDHFFINDDSADMVSALNEALIPILVGLDSHHS